MSFSLFAITYSLLPATSLAYVAPGLTAEGTLTNGTDLGFFPQYGDINGDGYKDLVISYHGYSSSKGRLFVYFGNGTNFSSIANVTITGEANSDFLGGQDFGNAFSIGNINNDGYDDILIGAYGNDEAGSSAGKIYIFYGSATISGDKIASQADLSTLGNLTDKKNIGISVKIFDTNNDNKNDIIIVAGTSNFTISSNIFTFLNTNNTFDFNNPNFTLATSSTNSSGVGDWIINSGDFNGDGNIDMLSNDLYQTGKEFLFIGLGTGEFMQTSIFTAELTTNKFGRYRSTYNSDINIDGKEDFCFGAYQNGTITSNQGRIYCFFGRSSFNSSYSVTAADIVLNGLVTNDNFGRTTYLYDVTNDGKPDLLVGAYQASATSGSRHGKFFIYKNTNGSFVDLPWLSEVKTSGNTLYGSSVSAFDWDNDGWANVEITQSGTGGGGTGNPVLNYFEISHGSPSLSATLTPPGIIRGVATDSNTDYNISGVEWSTSSNSSGTWHDCASIDASFDSGSEEYICDATPEVDGSGKRIYIRTHDQNDLYMPSLLYANIKTQTTAGPSTCSDSPVTTTPTLVSAVSQSSSSVLLTFTQAQGADHYAVEYGTKSGVYQFGAADIGTGGTGNIRTYLVKSLSPSTKYYFRVRGGNGCAVGGWSNEVSNTTNNLELKIKNSITTNTDISETPTPLRSLGPAGQASPSAVAPSQLNWLQLCIQQIIACIVSFFKNIWNNIRR